MAASSLFEDDEVCHVTPDKTYRYGLVLENADNFSSDEEDSRPDVCKKGCVRIAWHPKGRESVDLPQNQVLLADRTLMPSDVVRRLVPGRDTQCGFVQDMQVMCHLHITATDKFIYNVDSKLLSPCIQFQKYDGVYITMDNWLGRVEEVRETVTIVLPDGARCDIDDSDACCLEDVTERRYEEAVFNEEYCYPGQLLKGVMGDLANATWLNSTLLHNARNAQCKKNSTFYASVEKVQITTMYVHWICRGYSKVSYNPDNKLHPLPREVTGADVERVQLVDWFDHCSTKLGDKMFYTIREEDLLETQLPKHRFVPHCVQHASQQRLEEVTHRHDDLVHMVDSSGRQRRKGSKKSSLASGSGSGSTVRMVDSSTSTTVCDAATTTEQDHDPPTDVQGATAPDSGGGDMEVDANADADDEYEDVEEGDVKGDDSASDAGSVSSSASGPKRRKRDKGHGLVTKNLKNAGRRPKRFRQLVEIPTTPGSRVATEVCYTFTLVNVMWQDGTAEEKIPSIELFPVHHLDELEFFPGSFIVDSKASEASSEYGVVMNCNHFERTCHVKWLKPYEVGQGTFPTEVIKASEVSVYDIYDHPDYKFRPGHSVIRVAGFEAADQTLQAVGQVMRLNPDGTITVHWCDGSSTSSYPQDLYIVWDMSDYSNSSNWETMESSEETDSDPSWETEEEEEQQGADGEGDDVMTGDNEEPSALKDMAEDRRRTIKQLLEQAQSYFNELTDLYTAHVAAKTDEEVSTLLQTSLLKCMTGILKIYKSCRKLDKVLKTFYFSVPEVMDLVSTIKYDIKKEKSNKIKQHLEQVFESTNRGLLKANRNGNVDGVRGTTLVGMGDTQVRTDMPDEGGTESSDVKGDLCMGDEGSPVDGVVGTGSMGTNGQMCGIQYQDPRGSSSVDAKDYAFSEDGTPVPSLREIENDISSMLAAANVGEEKAAGAASLPNGETVTAEDLKSSEACASPSKEVLERKLEAAAKNIDCLDTVHNITQLCVNLCKSLQDTIDTIYVAMDINTDGTKTADVAAKASETISTVEKGTDAPPPETMCPTCPVHAEEKEGSTESCCRSCPMHEGKGEGVEGGDMGSLRADSQDACSSSNSSEHVSPTTTGIMENIKEEEEEEAEDVAAVCFKGFLMCGEAPSSHRFIHHSCHPNNPRTFNVAVKKELKLLRTSLPEGIIVKGYEDRMDLFSVLIEGPAKTPYEDGVFMFDVMLPQDYPTSPPHCKYLSFCHDRLNPNLYADGKVCVSLLGTWSGKGMEVWTDKSNLLQVLVSIQGLILVDEPYYNEAGYEKQRGQQIALENSRLYNEMAMLRLVESLTSMAGFPPKPFVEEVCDWLLKHGPRLKERLVHWMALSETMLDHQHVGTSGDTDGAGSAAAASSTPQDTCSTNNLSSIEPASQNHEQTSTSVQDLNSSPVEPQQPDTTGASVQDLNSSPVEPQQPDTTGASVQDSLQACVMPSPPKPKPPPGHPDFPLLPMSKGFRLTLQKCLVQFEAAISKLQQTGTVSEENSASVRGSDVSEAS